VFATAFFCAAFFIILFLFVFYNFSILLSFNNFIYLLSLNYFVSFSGALIVLLAVANMDTNGLPYACSAAVMRSEAKLYRCIIGYGCWASVNLHDTLYQGVVGLKPFHDWRSSRTFIVRLVLTVDA
jgi:hypothetical protein